LGFDSLPRRTVREVTCAQLVIGRLKNKHMQISSKELRQKFLEFFKSKGHAILPAASVVPENDPTVLFTTAGMHPLVPYLLGSPHPEGQRLTNVQKCIRTQDIDEVGDNRHDTFFEMLGNWSLGDATSPDGIGEAGYFKDEAIKMSWDFLTLPEWLGLDKKKLAVSVFAGDSDAPRDDEAAKIWLSLGVPEHKIAYLGKEANWWGPAGQSGPCGPDTEMFYWVGGEKLPTQNSNPGNDEGNWLEIWNDVFMQYLKTEKGNYEPLKQKNVDTGMGLERTLVALNALYDVFQIDTFWPIVQEIEKGSGKKYLESDDITKSMRIIADHVRTATMIMGDDLGIAPSNVDQGYIVRRLVRRSVRHANLIGLSDGLSKIVDPVIKIFADTYPEVQRNRNFIINGFRKEEEKFSQVLSKGIKEFERVSGKVENKIIEGLDAFNLFSTYGFPFEMTKELAGEKGLKVDEEGFLQEFKKHQATSRIGAAKKFSGGLADHSEQTTKLHTANHLLQAALRNILGEHVGQKGSNITKDRLRFDFTHDKKMTDAEKKQVEDLVNAAITKNYAVSFQEMTVEKAKEKGALGFFEGRYGEKVKVYTVGDPERAPTGNAEDPTFSMEICGGPHVEHTDVIGKFKIKKEEAVSAGIRRIKAVIE
jgi:alanyl-tRNA synthetase